MAYHIVGLDIGSRTVRAVLLERSFRGYEVGEARQAPIAQPEDGSLPPPEAVGLAVQAVIGDLPRGQTSVVCAYPLERASTWFLGMPFTDPKRVAQTVAFEIEDTVPFDLEDMLVAWRVQRTEQSRSEILAALAPRKAVGERLASLETLGIDPIALLLDAQVLSNALSGRTSEPVAVVDVGHRRTLVSVVRDGAVEHVQLLPVGGLGITRALAERFGLSLADAEHLKIQRVLPVAPSPAALPVEAASGPTVEAEDEASVTTLSWHSLDDDPPGPRVGELEELAAAAFGDEDTTDGSGKVLYAPVMAEEPTPGPAREGEPGPEAVGAVVSPAAVQEVIAQAMAELMGAIRAALVAYETSHKRGIARVVLTGGGAQLVELPAALETDLGIPAARLARLGEDAALLPGVSDPSCHALAFALGLRGVTDGRLREIDLRREEFATRGNIHRVRLVASVAVAAVALFLVVGIISAGLKYRALRAEAADIDAQITALVKDAVPGEGPPPDSPEAALVVLTDAQMALTERARILGVGEDAPPTALKVLQEVSDNLSPGFPGDPDFIKVDVDEYTASESTVKIKGYTDSFDATGKIEASVKKSPIFVDVTMSDVTSDRRQEDRKNFTLTFTVSTEGGGEIEDPS